MVFPQAIPLSPFNDHLARLKWGISDHPRREESPSSRLWVQSVPTAAKVFDGRVCVVLLTTAHRRLPRLSWVFAHRGMTQHDY
jgi:hypothetical protein